MPFIVGFKYVYYSDNAICTYSHTEGSNLAQPYGLSESLSEQLSPNSAMTLGSFKFPVYLVAVLKEKERLSAWDVVVIPAIIHDKAFNKEVLNRNMFGKLQSTMLSHYHVWPGLLSY